jgi:hypothetical protein
MPFPMLSIRFPLTGTFPSAIPIHFPLADNFARYLLVCTTLLVRLYDLLVRLYDLLAAVLPHRA